MKRKDLQRMLGWLSQILSCPICDSQYNSESTRLIDSRTFGRGDENAVVIHSDCPNCKSSVVFNISMVGSEVFSVGVVSDLNTFDAIKFRQAKPISPDEILNFHDFLLNFDGNFERMLR